jgi:hypothetical protein
MGARTTVALAALSVAALAASRALGGHEHMFADLGAFDATLVRLGSRP